MREAISLSCESVRQGGGPFGANLKDTYDAEGDDQIIEELIMLYEAGLL